MFLLRLAIILPLLIVTAPIWIPLALLVRPPTPRPAPKQDA